MSDRDRPLFAVLIDADNVPPKHAEAILSEITAFGEPALRRVYGDWSSPQMSGWKGVAASLGLVQQQLPSNTTGKNATDIGLVIDAMDILHSGRFDGFVLVSSDSDFTALAGRIREQGLSVIGIGEGKTPPSLRNSCNRFILIENIEGQQAEGADRATDKKNSVAPPVKPGPLIDEAMKKIDPEGEWFNLGQIGQAIQAAKPDFDTRSYGKAKLSELIEGLKGFETRRNGNVTEIRRKPG